MIVVQVLQALIWLVIIPYLLGKFLVKDKEAIFMIITNDVIWMYKLVNKREICCKFLFYYVILLLK